MTGTTEARRLSFEQTIGELHGMLGERVSLGVSDTNRVMAVVVRGRLQQAHVAPDLADEYGEALVFDVREGGSQAEDAALLIIASDTLRGAWRLTDTLLALEIGESIVTLTRWPDAASTAEASR